MSAALGTLPGWRGPLARRIESPRVQAALIALILVNAVILSLETGETIYAPFMHAIFASAPLTIHGVLKSILVGAIILPVISVEQWWRNRG